MHHLVLGLFAVLLTILRLMDRQKELIRFLKTCLELAHSPTVINVKNVCYSLNSHTTTVTKRVSKWLHSRHCTDKDVEPL